MMNKKTNPGILKRLWIYLKLPIWLIIFLIEQLLIGPLRPIISRQYRRVRSTEELEWGAIHYHKETSKTTDWYGLFLSPKATGSDKCTHLWVHGDKMKSPEDFGPISVVHESLSLEELKEMIRRKRLYRISDPRLIKQLELFNLYENQEKCVETWNLKLREEQPELVDLLKNRPLEWNDIPLLSDQNICKTLTEIDSTELATALTFSHSPVKTKFLQNISLFAGECLIDDIKEMEKGHDGNTKEHIAVRDTIIDILIETRKNL